ncbi:unnamed protein product [Umbelopsis sp. WA50703]
MLLLGVLALAHRASAIKNLVVFGDSYSDIGNVGIFTDNANWVQDLSYAWNAALYDYAYGGATCDNSIEQYVQVPSASEQVANYIANDKGKDINATESVYALFIGINDANIFNATRTQSVADCVSQQMRSLQQAYGARTFLILNLPPMQDSPGGLAATPDLREAKADWVAAYNQILNASVHSLENSVELFVFNTYDLFTTVLANATAYGFTNTTGYWNQNSCANLTYCPENPGGIMGANEYIWFDGTHVTSGMAFETKSFVQD